VKVKALEELLALFLSQDYSKYTPNEERKELLNGWISRWICEVEEDVLVLDRKFLTSENEDAIKYKLTEKLAEKLAEDCTTFETKDRKIGAKLLGIRRKPKQ
jgi:hypothetical protein